MEDQSAVTAKGATQVTKILLINGSERGPIMTCKRR